MTEETAKRIVNTLREMIAAEAQWSKLQIDAVMVTLLQEVFPEPVAYIPEPELCKWCGGPKELPDGRNCDCLSLR